MKEIYEKIIADPRYQENIQYGKPRRGHAEGTVAAHIADLEDNLEKLVAQGLICKYLGDHYWKLKVLIHVHDTFKKEAKRDSAILDPHSHASLARAYLATMTEDSDMLNITQFHDIGYSVFKKMKETRHFWGPLFVISNGPGATQHVRRCGRCGVMEGSEAAGQPCMDEKKLMQALWTVQDMNLFLLFAIIDACTPSKGRQMIRWFVAEVNKRFPETTIRPEHVLEGSETVEGAW